MKNRDVLRKQTPTAVYNFEIKIEEHKRIQKELTALEG
jgi:hypothetical protein